MNIGYIEIILVIYFSDRVLLASITFINFQVIDYRKLVFRIHIGVSCL